MGEVLGNQIMDGWMCCRKKNKQLLGLELTIIWFRRGLKVMIAWVGINESLENDDTRNEHVR